MASDPAASEHTTNTLYISGTLVLLLEAFGCQVSIPQTSLPGLFISFISLHRLRHEACQVFI